MAHLDTPLFSDTQEEEASHPEVVSKLNARARTDLELPLGRHHLGVDPREVDSSIQAGTLHSHQLDFQSRNLKTHVVRLNEVTRKDLPRANATIIRPLRTGEPHLGPSVDLSVRVEQGVLLLEPEPRLLRRRLVHHLLAVRSVVGMVGRAVIVVAFAENEYVCAPSEGVFEYRRGALSTETSAICYMARDAKDQVRTSKTSELPPGA